MVTEIINYLEGNGHYIISTNTENVIAVCNDGRFILICIEVKAEGKRKNTTKWQEFHLNLVKMSGGKAFVADSVYDVIEQGL